MKIVGVLPVHNEEEYLPLSLGSLKDAPLDGLLIYLDRCTDRSKERAESFKPRYRVIIHEENGKGEMRDKWTEAYQRSHLLATELMDEEDVLFTLAADIIYPPQVFQKDHFDNADCVSFYYEERDTSFSLFRNAFANVVSKTSPFLALNKKDKPTYRWYNFGVRKHIFIELNGFREVPRVNGTEFMHDFLLRLIQRGYSWILLKKPVLKHLRTGFRPEKQWEHGIARAEMGYSFWRVFLHSVLYFKPLLMKGYMWRRLNKNL